MLLLQLVKLRRGPGCAVLSDVVLFSYFTYRQTCKRCQTLYDNGGVYNNWNAYLWLLFVEKGLVVRVLHPNFRNIGFRTGHEHICSDLWFCFALFGEKSVFFFLIISTISPNIAYMYCMCIGAGGWNQSRSHRQVPWGAPLPPAGEISPCPFIFQLPNIGVNVKYTVSWQKIN